MLASSKTSRKAAVWGNGVITSADSSGFAGSVSRTDSRLDCSDSMPSAFRTRAGSSPNWAISSAARLSASSTRAASRSTGSTEDPPRAGRGPGPDRARLCAGRVCVVHPLTRPFARGTRMDCTAFGARGVCPNETSRGQSVVIVEMERISAGSLEFPCPPSHHCYRFVRQSPH